MIIPDTSLCEITKLYETGLYRQAYDLVIPYGEFANIEGKDGLLICSRIAAKMDAPSLSHKLIVRAYRQYPDDPEVIYYYACRIYRKHGALAAWWLMRGIRHTQLSDPWIPASNKSQEKVDLAANWLALKAVIMADLRDFDTAHALIDQAFKISDHSWIHIEAATVLYKKGQIDAAYEVINRILSKSPNQDQVVLSICSYLQMLDRDDEAIDLLQRSSVKFENPAIVLLLIQILNNKGRYKEASELTLLYIYLAPLMEETAVRFLASIQAAIAYFLRDFESYVKHTFETANEHNINALANLVDNIEQHRIVCLPVPNVYQHYMECVPATIAAISKFWNIPIDPTDIADEISFSGTTWHDERSWVEHNGFVAREFRMTWESACGLIDSGIPFTLSIINPGVSHSQVVMGYNLGCRILYIRDPSHITPLETAIDYFTESQKAYGPRAMVYVPADRIALLNGLELPDSELYDLLYSLNTALKKNDRDTAWNIYLNMHDIDSRHPLTINGRRAIAYYDFDIPAQFECVNKFLELYPNEPNLHLERIDCMEKLSMLQDLMTELDAVCSVSLDQLNPKMRSGMPLFLLRYAQVLLDHYGMHDKARKLIIKAMKYRPDDPHMIYTLAKVAKRLDVNDVALELLRFAVCLDVSSEDTAAVYFKEYMNAGKADIALKYLNARYLEYRNRSSFPSRALYTALKSLGDMSGAIKIIEEVLEDHPDDTSFKYFAAAEYTKIGHYNEAEKLLALVKPQFSSITWLKSAAHLASCMGDIDKAIEYWYEIININPDDVITRRTFINYLVHLQRITEAISQAKHVIENQPIDIDYLNIASLYRMSNQYDLAIDAYRQAICLNADNTYAIGQLLLTSPSPSARGDALKHVASEIMKQKTNGEGIIAYYDFASQIEDSNVVIISLEQIYNIHSNVWQAWSVLIRQYAASDRLAEALSYAMEAIEQFPMVAQLYVDLAVVYEGFGSIEDIRAALNQAIEIAPDWSDPVLRLSSTYEKYGDYAEATRLLREAVREFPQDCRVHAMYANILWNTGEKEKAFDEVKTAVSIDIDFSWAWNSFIQWSLELNRNDEVINFVKNRIDQDPDDPILWEMLAEATVNPEAINEKIEALQHAVALDPGNEDTIDTLAESLANANRIDEAIAACHPEGIADIPTILKGRLAWISMVTGDAKRAIEEMQVVLDENPNYLPGWKFLFKRAIVNERFDLYLKAASAITKLEPENPEGFGNLGNAEFITGNRDAAKTALYHALQLHPDYPFAISKLIEAHLDDNEISEAEAVYEHYLEYIANHEDRYVIDLRFALLDNDVNEIVSILNELFQIPGVSIAKYMVIDYLKDANRLAIAEMVLRDLVKVPNVDRAVGKIWVHVCIERNNFGCSRDIVKLARDLYYNNTLETEGSIIIDAASRYMLFVAREEHKNKFLEFVREIGKYLKSDNGFWGSAGYGLITTGFVKEAAEWLSDWEGRQNLEQWMLSNCSEALREVGNDHEAARAIMLALELINDYTHPQHQLWRAYDLILEGSINEALDYYAEVESCKFEDCLVFLRFLVHALLIVNSAAKKIEDDVFQLFTQAVDIYPNFNKRPLFYRIYLDTAKRVRDKLKSPKTLLWYMRCIREANRSR